MTTAPLKVLFVEEDVADRTSVERFFQSYETGYRVESVASADEAVLRLRTSTYDVALIDYRFNDGTAFDLLNKLGDTPAIFLTGGGQEEIAVMALKRGAYDYLIKDSAHSYLMLLPGTIEKVLIRKHAEQALKESEARYRDLLDTVLDTYLCINEQGSILLINRAGARQLGYTVSELLGQSFFKLAHPGDAEKLKKEFLIAASRPEDVRRVDYRQIRKDGRILQVAGEIRAQPQRGRLFPVIRILCREIEPLKKVEPRPIPKRNAMKPVAMPVVPPRPKPVPISAPPVAAPAPVPTEAPASVPVSVPASAPAAAPTLPPVGAIVREITDELKGTERVLVVDDEPEQRSLAARMLSKLGYRVVTAESGRVAVELMKSSEDTDGRGGRRSPFDLVVTDMMMENGFDGLETYRQIAKIYPGQKCIIVSGFCEGDRVREAQSLGAGRFVSKPYTFRTIGQAVREELNRKA